MSRPRSEDRRNAILAAATQVIASQGLGAATATIAKEAGVANGSLFLYFDTKSTLFNELYVELKGEMAAVAGDGLPAGGTPREQLSHMWDQWVGWATEFPDKRRALAQLQVSDEITQQSHVTASLAQQGSAIVMERSRENGALRDVPLGFVVTLTAALAESTIDAILEQPARGDEFRASGFEAMWRMLN